MRHKSPNILNQGPPTSTSVLLILCATKLKYVFCNNPFRKDAPLTSWTLFHHICPHFRVGLLNAMTCYKTKWCIGILFTSQSAPKEALDSDENLNRHIFNPVPRWCTVLIAIGLLLWSQIIFFFATNEAKIHTPDSTRFPFILEHKSRLSPAVSD